MGRAYLKAGLVIFTAFVAILIYAPIISMIIFSFNPANRMVPPIEGVSLRWYIDWINNEQLVNALLRSLRLAILTMLVCIGLFTPAGLAYKKPFRGSEFFFYLIILGLILPGIAYGLGAVIFFKQLGVMISFWTGLPVHTVWCLPWGLILVRAMMDPMLVEYEDAARTLGASELKVFRSITLPITIPAILGGALFAFTLSIGELFRSTLTITPDTLPLRIFGIVQIRATPALLALGSTITIVSLALLVVVGVIVTRSMRARGVTF